jgi:hypothetical protein
MIDNDLIDGAPHVTWTAIPSVSNNVITSSRLQKKAEEKKS